MATLNHDGFRAIALNLTWFRVKSEIKEGVEVCRNSRYKISMEEYLAERSMLFNAWSEFSCLDSMGIAYQFDGNKLLPIRLDKGPL